MDLLPSSSNSKATPAETEGLTSIQPKLTPISLSSTAQRLISENTSVTNKFYTAPSDDTSWDPSPEEQSASRLRRSLQLSFSPFAPAKRQRTDLYPRLKPKFNGGDTTNDGSDHVGHHEQRSLIPVSQSETALALRAHANTPDQTIDPTVSSTHQAVVAMRTRKARLANERPTWHPPWRLYRVLSGHVGWVRSIAFDAENEWFATGSADRTIKIWDSASGKLKLTLTGHVAAIRAIQVSSRRPYMFSVGEDKMVKCWDLEQNKVIRNYHGHLSAVYCAALHPTLDVLLTGGRDSTVRVWDIRTRAQVHVFGGHRDTVNAVLAQAVDPQLTSASVDSTIRLWDLAAGRCRVTLTNHKKGVRALATHPREFSFASASADAIKTWAFPDGVFMRNLVDDQSGSLINALAVNEDGVAVAGGDDGVLSFWDYSAAHRFDSQKPQVQPGSLDCEAGVYALSFDRSGSRLVTGEADKTVRMWREDENATEETHPLNWKPEMRN